MSDVSKIRSAFGGYDVKIDEIKADDPLAEFVTPGSIVAQADDMTDDLRQRLEAVGFAVVETSAVLPPENAGRAAELATQAEGGEPEPPGEADKSLSFAGALDTITFRDKALSKIAEFERGTKAAKRREESIGWMPPMARSLFEALSDLQLAGGMTYSEAWIPSIARKLGMSIAQTYSTIDWLFLADFVDVFWAPGTYTETGDFIVDASVPKADADDLRIGMGGGAMGYVRLRNRHPVRSGSKLPSWKSVAKDAYTARWGEFENLPEDETRNDRIHELLDAGAPLVVSWGIGRDSTAMLIGMARRKLRPDAILYAEVGAEKPETYAYRPYFDEYLRGVGFPRVQTVKKLVRSGMSVKPGEHLGYKTLEEELLFYGNLPSIAYGFQSRKCSEKWKVVPQEAWCEGWPVAHEAWRQGLPIVRAIGFDASTEELRRAARGIETPQYVNWYPLQEWGWDLDRVIKEIKREGLRVPVKSACYFCSASQPWEVAQLVAEHPEYIEKIEKIEAKAAANPKTKGAEGLWFKTSKDKPGSWTEFIRELKP